MCRTGLELSGLIFENSPTRATFSKDSIASSCFQLHNLNVRRKKDGEMAKSRRRLKLSYVHRHISPRVNPRGVGVVVAPCVGFIFIPSRGKSVAWTRKKDGEGRKQGCSAPFSVVSFLAVATASKGRIRLPPTRLNWRHSRLVQDNLGRCLPKVRVVDTFQRKP